MKGELKLSQVFPDPPMRLREHANGWGCVALEVDLFARDVKLEQQKLELDQCQDRLTAAGSTIVRQDGTIAQMYRERIPEDIVGVVAIGAFGFSFVIGVIAVLLMRDRGKASTGSAGAAMMAVLLLAGCVARQQPQRYQDGLASRFATEWVR